MVLAMRIGVADGEVRESDLEECKARGPGLGRPSQDPADRRGVETVALAPVAFVLQRLMPAERLAEIVLVDAPDLSALDDAVEPLDEQPLHVANLKRLSPGHWVSYEAREQAHDRMLFRHLGLVRERRNLGNARCRRPRSWTVAAPAAR